MKATPLFDSRVRVRLLAPTARFDGHEGTVDAHELHTARASTARKHPPILTIHLDAVEATTLAFADELELLGSPGGSCRQELAAGQHEQA